MGYGKSANVYLTVTLKLSVLRKIAIYVILKISRSEILVRLRKKC